MSIIVLILGLLFFVGLVVTHELGHFWAARRNGVEVEEFGIGFPPRAKILAKKKGTLYTLNWLPLGGFVKLKGEYDSDTQPGSFGAASLGAKLKIALAGVVVNFLVAALLLSFLALVGMPKGDLKRLPFYERDQFTIASDMRVLKSQVFVGVVPDSPAAKAGLQDGDEIIRIGSTSIMSAETLPATTEQYRGQVVDLVYKRGVNGNNQTTQVTLLKERNEDVGYLGVAPINSQVFRATWSAPIVGFVTAAQYTELTFRGLGYVISNLFQGQTEVASNAVGGPVATIAVLNDTAAAGLYQVLFIIALISISLAVMNVLPIPALDGGRVFIMLAFRLFGRRLTKRQEELIHGTGFVVLLGLIMLVTVIDIRRLF
jgi:regulator of sigma E protease